MLSRRPHLERGGPIDGVVIAQIPVDVGQHHVGAFGSILGGNHLRIGHALREAHWNSAQVLGA